MKNRAQGEVMLPSACAAMYRHWLLSLPLPASVMEDGRAVGDSAGFTLVFGERHRVHFAACSDARALIQARIVDFNGAGLPGTRLLEAMAAFNLKFALKLSASCVLDADSRAVWLQWICLPVLREADFAQCLTQFLDMLSACKAHLIGVIAGGDGGNAIPIPPFLMSASQSIVPVRPDTLTETDFYTMR